MEKKEEVPEPTFEEQEAVAEAELEDQYSSSVEDDLAAAISDLGSETDDAKDVAAVDTTPEYDVGDASADDLLEEEELVSHYDVNVVDDVDLEKADSHLDGVDVIGDISKSIYEEE